MTILTMTILTTFHVMSPSQIDSFTKKTGRVNIGTSRLLL